MARDSKRHTPRKARGKPPREFTDFGPQPVEWESFSGRCGRSYWWSIVLWRVLLPAAAVVGIVWGLAQLGDF